MQLHPRSSPPSAREIHTFLCHACIWASEERCLHRTPFKASAFRSTKSISKTSKQNTWPHSAKCSLAPGSVLTPHHICGYQKSKSSKSQDERHSAPLAQVNKPCRHDPDQISHSPSAWQGVRHGTPQISCEDIKLGTSQNQIRACSSVSPTLTPWKTPAIARGPANWGSLATVDSYPPFQLHIQANCLPLEPMLFAHEQAVFHLMVKWSFPGKKKHTSHNQF